MKSRARYADQLARDALELVTMVRDIDPDTVGEHLASLDRQRLEHLIVALAAMVPDDRPVSELLAWCDPDEQRRKTALLAEARRPARVRQHGTHSAFNLHKKKQEDPCEECLLAERLYQRLRARRRRSEGVAA